MLVSDPIKAPKKLLSRLCLHCEDYFNSVFWKLPKQLPAHQQEILKINHSIQRDWQPDAHFGALFLAVMRRINQKGRQCTWPHRPQVVVGTTARGAGLEKMSVKLVNRLVWIVGRPILPTNLQGGVISSEVLLLPCTYADVSACRSHPSLGGGGEGKQGPLWPFPPQFSSPPCTRLHGAGSCLSQGGVPCSKLENRGYHTEFLLCW